ncbi:MAG TPA: M50 family metallopeptidase [Acidimicrobiales bacterium]|nr:M50 family metallopeptidase [Acidimicrobiales bacterium]
MTATHSRPESDVDTTNPPSNGVDAQGLMRLGIIVALLTALSIALHIGGGVLVVVAILAMIMMHEFGHFITARWAGMKVTDFFVGFGPVLWSVQKGETRYGVRALPAGGYVRVIGMNNLEEVAPEDESRTYRAKSYFQRVRFAVAGSVTHFLMAYLLMVALLAGVGVAATTTTLDRVIHRNTDGSFSPAYAVGMRAGDKIVALNGTPMSSTDFDKVAKVIQNSAGRSIDVTVDRAGRRVNFIVTPTDTRTAAEIAQGAPAVGHIGIEAKEATVRKPLPVAMWHGATEVEHVTVDSAKALVGMFSKSNVKNYGKQLTETGPADPKKDGNRLLSPVGLARIANASAKEGVGSTLFLLIAINVFVGIFNMLPLPPFDGGHVAVATYEEIASRIKGRRHTMDMNKMLPVAYVVVVALALLSLSALWLDIVHPFKLG